MLRWRARGKRLSGPRPGATQGTNLCAPRAQASVETLLLIGMGVSALVLMAVYLQRAYQGYLYANASAHGTQFDAKQNFTSTQSLNGFNQVTDVDVTSGQQAIDIFGGGEALPSPSGGSVAPRALGVKVKVVTTWDVGNDGTYHAGKSSTSSSSSF